MAECRTLGAECRTLHVANLIRKDKPRLVAIYIKYYMVGAHNGRVHYSEIKTGMFQRKSAQIVNLPDQRQPMREDQLALRTNDLWLPE